MPKVTTNLRVFLSSPGDLSEERTIFKAVIDESNRILSDSDIRFELVMWETDTYPSIGKDAQSIINEQIGDNYDIFIGLMWTRFGTPTPRAGSGTEEEFNLALEKLERNPANSRILFYFKDSSPESLSKIDLKQLEKVNEFKKQLRTKGLVWDYKNLGEFKEIVRNHLLSHARDFRKTWGFDSPLVINKVEKEILEVKEFISNFEVSDSDESDGFKRTNESDNIRVFPSKKVYARLNTDEDWKKEFTVRYPILEGIQSESILFKINSILSYEKIFDVSLEESINGDTWLSELDYNIDYFKKPFLSITFHMDGIGAYPWHTLQSIVVNIETGERLKIVDILEETSLERLSLIIDKFVQIDLIKACLIDEYWNEIPLEESSEEFSPDSADISWTRERFGNKKFTIENLNEFSIDEYGLTFIYDFEFPHVIKAIEPEGHYYFEFSALKQFIKKDSVLEKFIEEVWKR